MRPLLILFAKAPVPGRVKTRLSPPLSPVSAARLHTAFVADMIESLLSLAGRADLELHTDTLSDVWKEAGVAAPVAQLLQCEGDLGLKMLQAMSVALRDGRPQAIIVGTDAPTLPREHLIALLGSRADVALGPSEDGGYYAIACRRVEPEMFRDVAWSSRRALEDTVAAARRCGLSVELGPAWFDVDTPGDLEKLRAAPALPRHTAKALRDIDKESKGGFDG